MQAVPSSSNGAFNQEPSAPPNSQETWSLSGGHANQQSNDGVEANLTPRQDPQGEESKLQEPVSSPKPSQQPQYIRPANGLEDKPIVIRHKPQSNSVPVQSSQYIHHCVNPCKSRSADSTSQIDKNIYGIAAPQYRPPPAYGGASVGPPVNVMQDKQIPGTTVSNHGLTQHNLPRNGTAITMATAAAAYNQGNEELLPPPPEYPGNRADVRRSYEVLDRVSLNHQQTGNLSQSSSQPELTNVPSSNSQSLSSKHGSMRHGSAVSVSAYKQSSVDQQHDFAAIAARASQMVEVLSEENKGLRTELECYYKKVSKLQKFEFELQRVHEAHDSLVKSSMKKEGLEKAIRMRQDMDIKQLEQSNRQNEEKVVMLEKSLSDQTSMLNDLSRLVTQHEETINQLTKLTNEQKDLSNYSQNKIKQLTGELASERSKSRSFEEELDAYKSNATITMEEESEVKMAALTQSTKDSERIIHEAQAEKLKYMDEAHQACKRVAHLEAKLKTLEASCAEKDAVVRVLQRRQRSNLSGRGQASPCPETVALHARRISEPTSGTTALRSSQLSIDKATALSADQNISTESLHTQTWQV